MSPDSSALLRLAESIADGGAVDWESAETRARDEERDVIRQLRVLSELAALHRSLPSAPLETGPAPAVAPPSPAIGTWGHLVLLERLGGGAFGEVYRAWDEGLQRAVALKLLRAGRPDDPETSRLVQEGRHLARVRHPNVVTVHGVAVHEGRVGLWMEIIKGATLEQLLGERGPFGPREAALLGIELCRGLAAVHAAGLVHRDVKAQNVMREAGGRVVLMDLGTGHDVATPAPDGFGRLAGTPLYLAPELFDDGTADAATDIYSVGVLLYRLVTSSFPVRGASINQLRAVHGAGRAVHLRDARPDLPAAFVRAVDRAIAVKPADRFRSAGELEAALLGSLHEDVADPDARIVVPAPVPRRPAPSESSGPARSESPERRESSGLLSWRAAAAAAAGVALVAAAVAWALSRGPAGRDAVPTSIRSIAVLPLVNLSGDQSQEYLADGLTDELIATLGRLGAVNVISRTSVAQFKGVQRSLPEIARQLNVDAVLEGTLRVTPPGSGTDPGQQPRVRVNARLILAGTDTQVWAQTFERVLTDALTLQSELAEAVAKEMRVELTGAGRSALADQGSRNADAQQAYLEGRAHLGYASRDRQVKAREALERAVRIDPTFARAHANLSVSYVTLELIGVLSGPDAGRLAKASAARALQLDDSLAEAHLAMADVQMLHDWRWSEAQSSYTRALALNPSYTLARRNYAWCLAALGRGKEALEQAQLGETADPLSPDARAAVAMMLYFNRQYDAAIAQMQKASALAPELPQEHNGLARAYAGKGAYADAIREIQQAIRLSNNAPIYVAELARIHAVAGDPKRARVQLVQLEQSARRSQVHVAPLYYAWVYAALGEKDRAFLLLDRSVRERVPLLLWAKVDPRLDPLRDDPRFAALLQQLGLPADR